MAGQARRKTGREATAAQRKVEKIWGVVERIPRGRVASYGQVAAAAGMAGRSRLVGFALRNLPPGMPVPWHRVLSASGRIAFPEGSPHWVEQCRLLTGEGVLVRDGKVDFRVCRWSRGLAPRRTR